MRKNYLSPSILSADFGHLGEDIMRTKAAGAPYLHYDVMDGLFVPSISFGMPVLRSVRKITDMVLDVHLMIQDPDRYIDEFADCGADIITVHYEACQDAAKTLEKIKAHGIKAGVTIKPGTPVEVLESMLDQADMILLMTVEPGFGGQAFMEGQLDTIRQVRALIEKYNPACELEVDGGIAPKTAPLVVEAGANVLVAGSAVYGAEDIPAAIQALRV